MIEKITSFSNEKLKYLIKLRNKSKRESHGEFTIEGYREIKKSLLYKNLEYRALFISRDCFLGTNEESIIFEFQNRNVKIFELKKALFEKISYRDRPDGLLALAKIPNFNFTPTKFQQEGKTFLVIEGVEKPGNLGTILRTAEGAGVSAVFVTDPKVDLFNPNVIRSSTGNLFTIPVFYASLIQIAEYFKKKQIPIIGITPEAKTYYFQRDLKQPCLFLFGSEQYGISEEARKLCSEFLSIPMNGNADSLNLAMSVGIILYDVLRQRLS